MLTLRKSDDRGHFNHGWLDTKHSFSFGSYFDKNHQGYRALRVINEDHIAPSSGFGTHPHRDMEIVTYVVSGAIKHDDSLGQSTVLKAGEFQRMTAGTGIRHSEYNPSSTEPTHILQIWIEPFEKGLEPSYQQISAPRATRKNELREILSPNKSKTALTVHQDLHLYALALDKNEREIYQMEAARHLWIQVVRGSWQIDELDIRSGDGVALTGITEIELQSRSDDGELLIFDLA